MAGSFQRAAAFTLLFHFFFLPFLVLIFHLLTGFGLSYTGCCARAWERERQREREVCDESTYIRIYATARRMKMAIRAHARGWTSLRLLLRASHWNWFSRHFLLRAHGMAWSTFDDAQHEHRCGGSVSHSLLREQSVVPPGIDMTARRPTRTTD